VEARVVAATQTTAPGEATHWTSAAMARHIGISVSAVQCISAARHPRRTFRFHAEIGVMDQCGGRLLRQAGRASPQTGHVLFSRRTSGGDQSLPG
jgi:hypothetical protein